MNKSAQALGRLNKGVPKNFTAAEIERRRKRLKIAAKNRWPNGPANKHVAHNRKKDGNKPCNET